MTKESVPSAAVVCSCTSPHFHAHPSQAGIQPGIPFGTASSLHLDLSRSSLLSLHFLLLIGFPLSGGHPAFLHLSFYGQCIEVEHELIFSIQSKILLWNIFTYFWCLQAVEEANLSQCHFVWKCHFFFFFFFFPFSSLICYLSEIIKCCDCFGLPSRAFTQLINTRVAPLSSVSTQTVWQRSGRDAKVRLATFWRKRGTWLGMCLGGSYIGCLRRPKLCCSDPLGFCPLTLKMLTFIPQVFLQSPLLPNWHGQNRCPK